VVADDLPRVISLSREQDRCIVSRNSRYQELVLASRFYHVQADRPKQQMVDLLLDLNLTLDPDRYLTRCLECNQPLVEIDKHAVAGRVWPYVWATQDKFSICESCGRIYWRATHAKAIVQQLAEIGTEIDKRRNEPDASE
jgi:hypothetical protein